MFTRFVFDLLVFFPDSGNVRVATCSQNPNHNFVHDPWTPRAIQNSNYFSGPVNCRVMTRFNDNNRCFGYHSAPCKNLLVVRFSLLTQTSGVLRGSSRVTTGNVRETICRACFWFRGRLGHYSRYHRCRASTRAKTKITNSQGRTEEPEKRKFEIDCQSVVFWGGFMLYSSNTITTIYSYLLNRPSLVNI